MLTKKIINHIENLNYINKKFYKKYTNKEINMYDIQKFISTLSREIYLLESCLPKEDCIMIDIPYLNE